jgi:hypothetical protein
LEEEEVVEEEWEVLEVWEEEEEDRAREGMESIGGRVIGARRSGCQERVGEGGGGSTFWLRFGLEREERGEGRERE